MHFALTTHIDPVILAGMGSLLLSLAFSAVSLARAAARGRKKP